MVGAVHIESTLVHGFGNGLMFAPPAGVTARLTVRDSSFSDNAGASVNIAPSGTGVAKAAFDHVHVDDSTAGFYIVAGSGGNAHVSIDHSSASGNVFYGIGVDSGGGPAQVMIANSVVSNNGTNGVQAGGANATAFIGSSTVSGNDKGLVGSGGAGLLTYGNNNVNMNYTTNLSGTSPGVQQKTRRTGCGALSRRAPLLSMVACAPALPVRTLFVFGEDRHGDHSLRRAADAPGTG
jgi:hypothetical protein